jgi:hypothetical protein
MPLAWRRIDRHDRQATSSGKARRHNRLKEDARVVQNRL